MQVRMLRSVAGPVGSFGVNRVVELPDEVAQRWITAGLCVALEPDPADAPTPSSPVKRKRAKRQVNDAQ